MHHLEIDNKRCINCRTCELACSFHHKKSFDPSIASLKIRGETSEVDISILFFDDMTRVERHKRVPCDHCKSEILPFCVKYCPVGAIRAQGGKNSFR
jgi:Fe-S-cluster-containing dehydrogenase component